MIQNLDFISAARSVTAQERVLRLVDLPTCVTSLPLGECSQTTEAEGLECQSEDLDRLSASASGLLDIGALGRRNRQLSLWSVVRARDEGHEECLVRLKNASAVWWVVAPASVTAEHLEDIGSQVVCRKYR